VNDYEAALKASTILFSGSISDLEQLDEELFLDIFDGVPIFEINKSELNHKLNIADLLAEKTSIFPSKGETRKMIQGGGVMLNKEKVGDIELQVSTMDLINDKYLLIQKGKKNYFLVIAK
jgi:tyrosyl-tRNA synthetase